MAEEWGGNLIHYLYDADGSPIGMQYRNTSYAEGVFDTYWFEKNLQGDVVAVYNQAGTKLIAYTYDAWGNSSVTYYNSGSSTTATYNPFRYRGYYFDKESGFYYLNSRYYDPAIGRFITADKLSTLKASSFNLTDKNLYAYCDNNPVTRTDDGGMFWDTVFDVVSLAFSIVEVVATPTNPMSWVGLAGDVLDLIPFVSGVGEVARVVGMGLDAVDTAKDLYKGTKVAENLSEGIDAAIDLEKATGSYEILYKSGKNYVGKGGVQRAITSAAQHAKPNKFNHFMGDEVVAIRWKQAANSRQAFIDEYAMQLKRGVGNDSTYNQIWSPGRKYFYEKFK